MGRAPGMPADWGGPAPGMPVDWGERGVGPTAGIHVLKGRLRAG